MTETSRFWDGRTSEGAAGDAGTYSSAYFAEFIAALMSDRTGVLSGLTVTESSPAAKSVAVAAGKALIAGRLYVNDASKSLAIADNASGNPRIDRIVVECDWTAQTIRLDVVQGTPAGSPVAPTLTQTAGTLWQESIAQVAVANGFTTITNSNITSERIVVIPGTYAGEIKPCALSTAPDGWLLCYGQAISRNIYAALFTAIGTTYGSGDGSTTFNVPDLRGRVWAGLDNMGGTSINRVTDAQADSLGGAMGAETHTLQTTEMPAHTHMQRINTYTDNTNTRFATKTNGRNSTYDANEGGVTGSTGGDGAHNNMQPTMFGNWILKT